MGEHRKSWQGVLRDQPEKWTRLGACYQNRICRLRSEAALQLVQKFTDALGRKIDVGTVFTMLDGSVKYVLQVRIEAPGVQFRSRR